MSETPPSSPSPSPTTLRPRWFLLGFLLMGLWLVWQGQRAQDRYFHGNFQRFHLLASPESRYLPTIDEMCSIVRGKCRPDQILVLIGGNSILNGVAQASPKLWSDRLQEKLGPRFCVINFALRGGVPSDAAAVVSEILRKEYPKQILVANSSPLLGSDPVGSDPYRFLIRQAFDRGLLEDFPARQARFDEFWPRRVLTPEYMFNCLDGLMGFRTYWNEVAWTRVSTVPYDLVPRFPDWLVARGRIGDPETDVDDQALDIRYKAQFFDVEMKVVRGYSETVMEQDPQGNWVPRAAPLSAFKYFGTIFRPEPLRRSTLILIGANSPFYRKFLSESERQREVAALGASVKAWESEGYASVEYGTDFDEWDYYDRTHLTGKGGLKLAGVVAAKIKSLSKELNYE